MATKRIPKQISLSGEEQVHNLEKIVANLKATANPQQSKMMGEPTISRMNQLIADGCLAVVWKQYGNLHTPILEMLQNQQPFKVIYSDVTGRKWGYTILYAEIVERMYKMNFIRPYLDCWCLEGIELGSKEIPELAHNWSLRIDSEHYASAEVEPVTDDWRSQGRDYIDVTLQFNGGLAWGYEGNLNDIQDSGAGASRTIIRRITSSYWFMRELAPHIICHPGSVKIVSPESIGINYGLRLC